MGLAEGVETALSAMQMAGMTVWASLGASRLHSVELPPEVEEVHVFVDNDEPGRTAAKRTAESTPASGAGCICGPRRINAATGTTS